MANSTLIAASLLTRRKTNSLLVENPRIDLLPDGPAGPRRFKIKAADKDSRRSLASKLLEARYLWRGYQAVGLPSDQSAWRFTLSALQEDTSIGTITVALDGPFGLAAADAFGPEIEAMRAAGQKLCEFTKLAIDPTTASKRVLAALFHVAFLVAHHVRGSDTLVIEVNPRHVRYYERMLGLAVIGAERTNQRVRAPAVLLSTPFAEIRRQIDVFGGKPELAASERTLYPFAFNAEEEAAIVAKLQATRKDVADLLPAPSPTDNAPKTGVASAPRPYGP
jgi:hypothetical protein